MIKLLKNKFIYKFWSKKLDNSKSIIKTLTANTSLWLTTVASACVISAIVGVNFEVGRDLNDKLNMGLNIIETNVEKELYNIQKKSEILATSIEYQDIDSFYKENLYINKAFIANSTSELNLENKKIYNKVIKENKSILGDSQVDSSGENSYIYIGTPVDNEQVLFVEINLNEILESLDNQVINKTGFYMILKDDENLTPLASSNPLITLAILDTENNFKINSDLQTSKVLEADYDLKYTKANVKDTKYYYKVAKSELGYIVSAAESSSFDSRITQIIIGSVLLPLIINIIAIYITMSCLVVVSSKLKHLNIVVRKLKKGEKITNEEKQISKGINEISILTNSVNELVETLERKSKIDGLTKIANRRYFDEVLGLLDKADRKISLLMIDVDYFKKYNDGYGHLQGDEVLKRVAIVLRNVCEEDSDLVARFGGEEFAIILADKDKNEAENIAIKILENIEAENIEHKFSEVSNKISVSIGISTMMTNTGKSYLDLVNKADEALYESKENGRNRFTHKE